LVAGWKDPLSGRTFQLPDTAIQFDTLENRYRAYLKSRFESLTSFNDAVQGKFTSWNQVTPPRQEALLHIFSTRKTHWRLEFLVRNYISVMEYIILHGRALMNTMIYCSLAILLALIVNPLAAYALSRYKPPTSYTILLFLMMTMAFPPMVTQIPVFLMLRQFNLLNTFWALVLPSIANGFSIFLLKGFFDSLPSDLYDSAALDGAGEFTIFWHITISLSKPILAVIALNAFTLAYSNFMMALLICQDEKMWTLMPWLYQLQQRSGQGVIFASLLIAAIPTFIVFSLCQNIIMRGIVIPVEK
jgi:multiple sugar transport system permease protein